MRHWEKHLRATPLPTPRGPVPREDYRGARCWHVQTHSPATYLGLQAVAARTQTDTARVLMALYAVALARITRVNPVVTRIVVSNRARPGLADVVGPVSQYGLCTIDVAGITVDEAVARARASVLSAAKYAYYDPSALDDLLVKLGRERDQPAGPPHRGRLHVGLSFNDRRRLGQPTPTDVLSAGSLTAAQLRSAVDEFSMTWDGPLDRYVDQLGIAVDNQPGTIDLKVSVDTHYLAPSELEAFLWELQAVAVEAAVDPATPTGVPYAAGDLDH
jgi:non-ribosomal peptide synthetase component F